MSSPLDVNQLDKHQLHLSKQLDQYLDRFEDAWNRGQPPSIGDFLNGVDDSLQEALLEELVAVDLERRWGGRRSTKTPVGEVLADPWTVESYIDQFPQLAQKDNALCRLILQEYRVRMAAGEKLIGEQIRQRFPELGQQFASQLEQFHQTSVPTLLRERFELAWRAGRQPVLEDYLESVEPAFRRDLLPELLLAEWDLKRAAGDTIDVDAYVARWPGDMLAIRKTYADWQTAEVFGSLSDANDLPARGDDALIGQRVFHFKIRAHLGSGGMGKVYLAEDERLGRQVALKVLASEFTRDADRIRRFERESRAASALNHPNIVTILDIGQSAIGHFIVMELVTGRTLSVLVRQPPPLEVVADIGRQIAESLEVAHAAGIVHRDIKPQNIMVRDDGYVKVLDFRLVRLVPRGVMTVAEDLTPLPTSLRTSVPEGEDSVTSSSSLLVGTASYMSPEQAQGQPVTPASDMFSLGIVLYQLATGRHPFAAESAMGFLSAIVAQAPVAPSSIRPEFPAVLEALILGLLEKDPHRRPRAPDVRQVLASFSEHEAKRIQRAVTAPRRRTIGRERELAQLHRAFDRASSGGGGLICVTGEPGIGKTTLVEDFLGSLASAARPVLIGRGRCSQRLAGTDAHVPFLEALDNLFHGPHGALAAEALRTIAPSWHAQLSPLSSSDSSADQLSVDLRVGLQDRTKRELAAFLAEIARTQPLVLFLDDLHWADLASVELLTYLATKFDQLPVLIITSARPTELILSDHSFLRVKLDLETRGVCQEMSLGFLSREAVGQYIAAEFPGHCFPREFIDLVYAKTEGSPLFLVDLVRHLRDRQLIVQTNGSWQIVTSAAEVEKEVPESVRSMILRKMEQLDDTDRRLLSTASVQGNEFDGAVVADVVKMDILDAEERLDRLDRVHSFVRCAGEIELPNSTLTTRYRFVHALYQNAFYSSLRTAQRVSLSIKVAESLLRLYAEKTKEVATELAILFEAGRDFQRAGRFYLEAARSAGRRGVHRQEAALLTHALRMAERLGQQDEIAELRARRGTAFFMVGMWGDARPDLDAALQGLPPERTTLRAKVLVVLASVCHWVADVPSTRRHAMEALRLAEQAGQNDLAAAALGALALADSSDGKLHTSLSGFEQAFGRAQTIDTSALAPHLELSGLVLYWLGRHEEAIGRSQDAVQIGRNASDSSTIVRGLGNLGLALAAAGRYREALEAFDEAQRLAKEYEVGTAGARALAMRGGLHMEVFDFHGAEALTEEARQLANSLNFTHPVISGGLDLMLNFTRRQDVGRAEKLIDEVATGVRQGAGAHGWLWNLRFAQAQAELALARGKWEEALGWAVSAIQQARSTGRVKYEVLGLEARAKALSALGREYEAIADLKNALDLVRPLGDPALLVRAAVTRLTIDGDDALAAEALRAAERITAALPEGRMRCRFQMAEPVQWLTRGGV